MERCSCFTPTQTLFHSLQTSSRTETSHLRLWSSYGGRPMVRRKYSRTRFIYTAKYMFVWVRGLRWRQGQIAQCQDILRAETALEEKRISEGYAKVVDPFAMSVAQIIYYSVRYCTVLLKNKCFVPILTASMHVVPVQSHTKAESPHEYRLVWCSKKENQYIW